MKNINVVVMSIFISLNTLAQWQNVEKIEVPEIFSKEDAVVLEKRQNLKVFNNEKVFTAGSIYKRIKILTKSGLENNNKIYFKVKDDKKSLLCRVHKSDGKIINVNSNDLLEFKEVKKSNDLKYIYCAIPNLEIGDEIEVIYKYRLDVLPSPENIFLHDELSCVKSTFTFSTEKDINSRINMYNGFSDPIVTEKNGVSYKWTAENLSGYSDNDNFSILESELPYVTFIITGLYFNNRAYVINTLDWAIILKDYAKYIEKQEANIMSGNKYEKQLFEEITKPNLSKEENLKNFIDYINNEIDITEFNRDELKTIGEQLSLKSLEELSVYRLYADYFDYLDIDYKMCVGRNKYTGNMDPNFATPNNLNYVFYNIYFEDGSSKFLVPKNEHVKYSLDEIPYVIVNTYLIEFDSDKTKNYRFVKIPETHPSKNKHSITGDINISIENLNVVGNINTKLTGQNALQLHSFYRTEISDRSKKHISNEFIIDKDNVEILDISSQNNKVSFNSEMNSTIKIVEIDNDLYSLKLSDFIQVFDNYHLDTKNRSLSYFTPFLDFSTKKLKLNFSKNIKIMNLDELNLNFDNAQGTINFSIKPIDEKSIGLFSNFIKKDIFIEKEEFSDYEELKRQIDKIENLELLIKVE